MIELNHDVYAEGAAIANGASAEIADLMSQCARDRFKKAFNRTLVAWLFRGNQENRNWASRVISIVTDGAENGASFDEVLDTVEREARRKGYL